MPIDDAQAVVLRQYSLAEADRIIVAFTSERGKMRLVAAGSKRPKSRLGGCLEPLNHVRIHYYQKEGAELARVRDCETIHAYLGKGADPDRFCAFSYFAEIVNEMSQENYANPLLFRLFISTLKAGERYCIYDSLLRYFEFWSLKISGFLPDYDYCSSCGKCVREEGFYAWVESGQGRCRTCAASRGLEVRSAAAGFLRTLRVQPPDEFASRPIGGQPGRDLERLSQTLLAFHLEKNLKSYEQLRRTLTER